MLFLMMATQWLISPKGETVGINYISLEATMNMNGIKKKQRPALFDDVRIMESVALQVFREKR